MLPKRLTLLLLVAFLESRINVDGETVEGDVIRPDTALVTVPVTVLDRNGRYIPLLKRENFRITENGVEQKLQEHWQWIPVLCCWML